MFRLAVLLLAVLVLPARANLGETIKECVVRYGKPINFTEANDKIPFGTLTFAAGNFGLMVFVVGEKEVGARVSKKDQSQFSPDEMKTIMDADSGSGWVTVPSEDPTCLKWTRGDKATLLYDKEKHNLIFTSDEMAKAMEVHASTPPASAPLPAAPPKSAVAPPAPSAFPPAN